MYLQYHQTYFYFLRGHLKTLLTEQKMLLFYRSISVETDNLSIRFILPKFLVGFHFNFNA